GLEHGGLTSAARNGIGARLIADNIAGMHDLDAIAFVGRQIGEVRLDQGRVPNQNKTEVSIPAQRRKAGRYSHRGAGIAPHYINGDAPEFSQTYSSPRFSTFLPL